MGLVRGGCGYCSACLDGYNWYCVNEPNNYGFTPGYEDTATWSNYVVVPAGRLAKIPDTIASEHAGPLMCAGQTVWLPLARTVVRPWDTVGVVGIGGLGHLAIQFAAKMGCKVVVFSGTGSKREEALKLGASEFYTAEDLKNGKAPRGAVKHLLVTTSQMPDWNLYVITPYHSMWFARKELANINDRYLPLLANQAHITPLTISEDSIGLGMSPLVAQEITVHGLCASTMTQVNQMLEFAARHKIRPMVEEFPMTRAGAAEAMSKLEKGQVRYRAVLKAQH